jgi:hypothetical protein
MVSLSSVTSRRVLCTSTTGVSPVTVTVSATPPTFSSPSILMTPVPDSSTSSRFKVANPESVNVTVYVPGCRLSMRYCPLLSDVAVRVFSIRTGLAASTLTPGSTAPDASLTVPARVTWAHAALGTIAIQTSNPRSLTARNIWCSTSLKRATVTG